MLLGAAALLGFPVISTKSVAPAEPNIPRIVSLSASPALPQLKQTPPLVPPLHNYSMVPFTRDSPGITPTKPQLSLEQPSLSHFSYSRRWCQIKKNKTTCFLEIAISSLVQINKSSTKCQIVESRNPGRGSQEEAVLGGYAVVQLLPLLSFSRHQPQQQTLVQLSSFTAGAGLRKHRWQPRVQHIPPKGHTLKTLFI